MSLTERNLLSAAAFCFALFVGLLFAIYAAGQS